MVNRARSFSDDPVDGSPSAPDLLGRGEFVQLLGSAIEGLTRQRESTVIGLVGSWGSGKTSLLRMARTRLTAPDSALHEGSPRSAREPKAWKVVSFNPWFFQDLPSLQWGFLNALFDAIGSAGDKRVKKTREALQTFGRTIAPVGAAGNLVGVDLTNILRATADLVGPNHSVERQQRTLAKILVERATPILIILDDLDRLSPDELLLVFKLIRLVGRLPYVHYLVAYDEDTLLDVLSRTGLVGLDHPHRAGAYLEKMVQLRFDVPPLRPVQLDQLADAALEAMAQSIDLRMDKRQESEFAIAWQMHMQSQIRTPRMLNRYVAQIESTYSVVATEVDIVDFLLLSWLRVVAPRLFATLPSEKAALTGHAPDLVSALGARKLQPADLSTHWAKLIEDAVIVPGAEHSVRGVLGNLFPRFASIAGGANSFPGQMTAEKKIANPDYFDRYFALAVPQEDISDVVLDAAYRAIVSGQSTSQVEVLEAALSRDTGLIVRKLESRFEQRRDPEEAYRLLMWLVQEGHRVPNERDPFGPRRYLDGLCVRLYLRLKPSEETLVHVLDEVAAESDGFRLIALMTGQARTNPFFGAQTEVAARAAAYPAALEHYGELIAQAFARNEGIGPFDLDDDTWSMMWDWRAIDPDRAQHWLFEQFRSGRWSRLDTSARLARSSSPVGADDWTISDLDLTVVDELVGLDELIAECRELPPLAGGERIGPGASATAENRRLFVRTVIDDVLSGAQERPRPASA